jgi:hypothetical protein
MAPAMEAVTVLSPVRAGPGNAARFPRPRATVPCGPAGPGTATGQRPPGAGRALACVALGGTVLIGPWSLSGRGNATRASWSRPSCGDLAPQCARNGKPDGPPERKTGTSPAPRASAGGIAPLRLRRRPPLRQRPKPPTGRHPARGRTPACCHVRKNRPFKPQPLPCGQTTGTLPPPRQSLSLGSGSLLHSAGGRDAS